MGAFGRTIAAAVLVASTPVLDAGTARAEERLRAIAAFPTTVDYTRSFLRFIDKVNEAGRGVVQIQFAGGPEVVPQMEQAGAVRRGVVDLQYGPASFSTGLVPEGDALVGSRRTPMETRANGGFALLRRIYGDKLNVHLLGHFDAGIGFHIYLKAAPPRTATGGIDLGGIKLRSQPIYREFFERLGATPLSVPSGETYTALGRGVVEGTGWPLIGITDLSWDRHLRYRVDPPFFQTDLITIVNLDRWNRLTQDARDVLHETALRHERESYDFFQEKLPLIDAEVRAGGMTVITLEGKGAGDFLDLAYEVPWSRLAGRDPTHVEELREKFYGD